MDLWQALWRLRERPLLVATAVGVAALLGILGWTRSSPTYSVTTSHILKVSPASNGVQRYSAGSFELGIIGSMITNNINTAGVPGATVTANNAVVSPPSQLPLITLTFVADSPQAAQQAADAALKTNREFVGKLIGNNKEIEVLQVRPTPEATASVQPRIRAAGSGAILGLLAGILALLIFDTLSRARQSMQLRGDEEPEVEPTPAVPEVPEEPRPEQNRRTARSSSARSDHPDSGPTKRRLKFRRPNQRV